MNLCWGPDNRGAEGAEIELNSSEFLTSLNYLSKTKALVKADTEDFVTLASSYVILTQITQCHRVTDMHCTDRPHTMTAFAVYFAIAVLSCLQLLTEH